VRNFHGGGLRDQIDRREGFRIEDSDRKVQVALTNYLFIALDILIVS
jgi:hypothetical protein